MSTVAELMTGSAPLALADRLGQGAASTVAAAGSTQGTATALVSTFTLISTAPASSGVVLKQARGQPETVVYNGGANTLTIYGNGTETINGIAAATGVSLPSHKAAILIANGNQWIGIISA